MPASHPERFRISDFGFAVLHARRVRHEASPYGLRPHKQAIIACHGVARRAKPDGAAVPAAHAGGTPALQGLRQPPRSPQSAWHCCGGPRCKGYERSQVPGTRVSSLREVPPAPSTHHNQPQRPSTTPTSRKASPGAARRGFPRAGGRGVGAGKKAHDSVPPRGDSGGGAGHVVAPAARLMGGRGRPHRKTRWSRLPCV
jgi:hypothetical protein